MDALLPHDGTRGTGGYKCVLLGLEPSTAAPADADDEVTAKLKKQLMTAQEAVRQLDAALSQRVIECAELGRCIECRTTAKSETGYGQVLLETEIGKPLKRIVRVRIATDTTNSQSPPYYVVFKTEKGGWMPYEMDPEEYKKVMAEVSFEATAGATAPKRGPKPHQSLPQTTASMCHERHLSSVAMPVPDLRPRPADPSTPV